MTRCLMLIAGFHGSGSLEKVRATQIKNSKRVQQ